MSCCFDPVQLHYSTHALGDFCALLVVQTCCCLMYRCQSQSQKVLLMAHLFSVIAFAEQLWQDVVQVIVAYPKPYLSLCFCWQGKSRLLGKAGILKSLRKTKVIFHRPILFNNRIFETTILHHLHRNLFLKSLSEFNIQLTQPSKIVSEGFKEMIKYKDLYWQSHEIHTN